MYDNLTRTNLEFAHRKAEKRIAELELELTVEKDQHQEEINLHLHAEEYNKSLEEANNKLLDIINNQDVKIADLEQQIEKMKCCANCKSFKGYGETCEGWGEPVLNLNCDCTEWELKEKEK